MVSLRITTWTMNLQLEFHYNWNKAQSRITTHFHAHQKREKNDGVAALPSTNLQSIARAFCDGERVRTYGLVGGPIVLLCFGLCVCGTTGILWWEDGGLVFL